MAAKLAFAKYKAYAIGAAVIGLFLLGGWAGYSLKGLACTAASALHEAQDRTRDAEHAIALAKATQDALEAERRHAADMAAIATEHEVRQREVQEIADRAHAAVLADNRRLRDHWRGCQATSEVVAGSAEPDGQDRLRAESLRRILEWVGLLQAQRDGLQEVVRKDREQ